MKIFKDKKKLKKEILGLKNLSFVPTMGGLHAGHKYLIQRAKQKKAKVLVSIYVNPKQFNSKNDYIKYPKNINKDLKYLKKLKVNYVFIPSFNDIFLFKPKNKIYLDSFSSKLCGKFRRNHFKGVINVINRFLEILNPKYIFLGKKDLQQLYLIKKHILFNKIKTVIIPCNTIREKNGMACSSRNQNLSDKQKIIGSKIYSFLIKEKITNKGKIINKYYLDKIKNKIIQFGAKKIDYLEFLNANNPSVKKSSKKKSNFFIAYYLKNTRLIDNL